jgi:hypothetical protein
MAGLLFGRYTDNKAVKALSTATIPVLVNGNGAYASAPALDEDPLNPMSNLLIPDRYTPWSSRIGTAGANIQIHLDLGGGANGAGAGGGDKTISSFAVMGLRGLGGSAPPFFINLGYRTRAQGYLNTGYTSLGNLNTGQSRDSILQFTAPPARYWEVVFTGVDPSGIAVGSLWLGTLQDVGVLWSSAGGGRWRAEHNVLWSKTAGGHMTGVLRGDLWGKYSLAFESVNNSTRSILVNSLGLITTGRAVLILDENNGPHQFMVMDGPQVTQRFNGLYDVVLDLEQLG